MSLRHAEIIRIESRAITFATVVAQGTETLNLCKQAAENLESIAKGLSKKLMIPGRFKKSYVSVKTSLQKGKTEKLKKRLQGAG